MKTLKLKKTHRKIGWGLVSTGVALSISACATFDWENQNQHQYRPARLGEYSAQPQSDKHLDRFYSLQREIDQLKQENLYLRSDPVVNEKTLESPNLVWFHVW